MKNEPTSIQEFITATFGLNAVPFDCGDSDLIKTDEPIHLVQEWGGFLIKPFKVDNMPFVVAYKKKPISYRAKFYDDGLIVIHKSSLLKKTEPVATYRLEMGYGFRRLNFVEGENKFMKILSVAIGHHVDIEKKYLWIEQ